MELQDLIIKKVGVDKLLHFFAGGWIAAFAPNWWIAILIAVFIGFLKELYDLTIRKSVFCWIDWLATALGGGVTAILLILM
ncbi:MAG: hypothetical protein LBH91_03120 [Prevotellaceae bacterium]|jgi:hypothetical protein|nr:hypothetical protein [Prevotellaceae bacterium]